MRLTAPERRAAAALILARGGTATDIAARLHVNGSKAAAAWPTPSVPLTDLAGAA